MAQPLNILFITADQWRGECLSALNHPTVKTPNLDALAAEGVLFARHYANTAPCGPSRTTLHTGLYLHNHRSYANGTPLDVRHTNWALESARLGYDPVLFGYTDISRDPRGEPDDSPWLRTLRGAAAPGIREIVPPRRRPQALDRLAGGAGIRGSRRAADRLRLARERAGLGGRRGRAKAAEVPRRGR